MVEVVSQILGDFLLTSSTADISIRKDKHWHKECASDKALLIYMTKCVSLILVLCRSDAILGSWEFKMFDLQVFSFSLKLDWKQVANTAPRRGNPEA